MESGQGSTTAAAQVPAGELFGSVSGPVIANSPLPRPMLLEEKIEGIKDFQKRQGDAGFGAGMPPQTREEVAQNLGKNAHKVLDGMPHRQQTLGTGPPASRMAMGRPGDSPPSLNSSQVRSSTSPSTLATSASSPPTQVVKGFDDYDRAITSFGLPDAPPCVGELAEPHEALKRALVALGAAVASLSSSVGITITTEDGIRSAFTSKSHRDFQIT